MKGWLGRDSVPSRRALPAVYAGTARGRLGLGAVSVEGAGTGRGCVGSRPRTDPPRELAGRTGEMGRETSGWENVLREY